MRTTAQSTQGRVAVLSLSLSLSLALTLLRRRRGSRAEKIKTTPESDKAERERERERERVSWLGKINGLSVGPSFCLFGHRQPGARPLHRLGLARHGSLIAPPPHPSRSWPRWPWSPRPRRLTKVNWASARTILGRDGIDTLNELKVRFGEQLGGEIK